MKELPRLVKSNSLGKDCNLVMAVDPKFYLLSPSVIAYKDYGRYVGLLKFHIICNKKLIIFSEGNKTILC